jgi:hypothetical protein
LRGKARLAVALPAWQRLRNNLAPPLPNETCTPDLLGRELKRIFVITVTAGGARLELASLAPAARPASQIAFMRLLTDKVRCATPV